MVKAHAMQLAAPRLFGGGTAPVLLERTETTFMAAVRDELCSSPDRVRQSRVPKPGQAALSLYQPIHRVFHVVVVAATCDEPGRPRVDPLKVESAARTMQNLNPDVKVIPFNARLTSANVDEVFDQGWDVIVDGLDNFPTRYLVNDASVWKKIPVVHGSIFRFDGQVTTFWPEKGPCYRCLYPEPPPAHLAPSCAEAGVLGILPGVIGTIQATEAIKILLGQGDPLVGRLLTYDSLKMQFRTLKLRRDDDCPVCGTHPTVTEYIDYEGFCAGGPAAH